MNRPRPTGSSPAGASSGPFLRNPLEAWLFNAVLARHEAERHTADLEDLPIRRMKKRGATLDRRESLFLVWRGTTENAAQWSASRRVLKLVRIVRGVAAGHGFEDKKGSRLFVLYRQALGKVLREYIGGRDEVSDRDAEQIFRDVLEPEIVRLRRAALAQRRSARTNIVAKTLVPAAVIGLGVFLGSCRRNCHSWPK